MCGIAGFVGRRSDDAIKPMVRSLIHRGPDAEGVYVKQLPSGVIALGHRRLSIIDLDGGNQPFFSSDKNVVAIVNGEIYNHREIRQRLDRRGFQFQTQSDCEVVVQLYEEYGDAFIEHLDGMYAVALWDERQQRLLLARDPIGKKPLYFSQKGTSLYFASEIKSLFATGDFPKEIDRLGVDQYLRYGYVPAPNTFYKGVHSLPAGHFLRWKNGHIESYRFYDLSVAADQQKKVTNFSEAVRRASTLCENAVKKRLISDVPIGVFLSGGVDSALVASLAARESAKPLQTFTIVHDEENLSFDERSRARMVSNMIGSEHREIHVQPSVDGLIERLIDVFDEPFADSSAIPTHLISSITSEELKVVLSGVGGDEAFCGYPRQLGMWLSLGSAKVPKVFRTAMDKWLAPMIPENEDVFNTGGRVRRFIHGVTVDPGERYDHWTSLFSDVERFHLLGIQSQPSNNKKTSVDYMRKALLHDAARYLPEDLLRMLDRCTMAHGLEARAPFCDPELLAFGIALPASLKFRFGLKSILKGVAKGIVPNEILRSRKQGFMVPISRWLRGELKEYASALLSEDACVKGELLMPKVVARYWNEHQSGQANHAHRLWSLVMLQAWRLQHLDYEVEPRCASYC